MWWRVMRPSSMVRRSAKVMVKRLPVSFRRCVLVPISTASGPSISTSSIDTSPSAGRQCSATSARVERGADPRHCRVVLDRPVHSPGDLGRVEVRDVVGVALPAPAQELVDDGSRRRLRLLGHYGRRRVSELVVLMDSAAIAELGEDEAGPGGFAACGGDHVSSEADGAVVPYGVLGGQEGEAALLHQVLVGFGDPGLDGWEPAIFGGVGELHGFVVPEGGDQVVTDVGLRLVPRGDVSPCRDGKDGSLTSTVSGLWRSFRHAREPAGVDPAAPADP